jgi:hypothetical protein
MELYFVEVLFDGGWYPVGLGCPTRDEAHWELAKWRQRYDCRSDDGFRVQRHELAEPPEVSEDCPF